MTRFWIWVGLLIMLASSSYALEFTQNTTFNNGNINFIFLNGTKVDSFQIVGDGLIINDEHKYVFVVEGGELDVVIYDENKLGLSAFAPQDIIFKITQNSKKQYLEYEGNYYIDKIPVGIDEKRVNVVTYKAGDSEFSSIALNVVPKDEWYSKKILVFEYDVQEDEKGVINSKFIGITYIQLIIFLLTISVLIWIGRRR